MEEGRLSQMKSAVVLHCVRCGKPVILRHLSTQKQDVDGQQLHAFMRSVAAHALCTNCQAQRNYYASINRLDDWEAGRP